ncbi:hypothetical protein TD95_002635 [Thielaviopsis punctulata]|uniref:Uncharacterized protein n=1 Tax=Thielaviopsis punctulata TaxID=72032 RepID=A0A0F4Z8I3_9PEZI|nr:hypothetical protein TD95_002635 [Thielaviopsis punctulata]
MDTLIQKPQTRPARPKLSLTTSMSTPAHRSSITHSLVMPNPTSPTAFNTVSNVYATAIERSTSASFSHSHSNSDPVTAINTKSMHSFFSYPETPLTAVSNTPPAKPEARFPNAMSYTPPLSAGPIEQRGVFSFANVSESKTSPKLTINTRLASPPSSGAEDSSSPQFSRSTALPYKHPRFLHSILRNSPLPPTTAQLLSPRRQARHLVERTVKHVGYNSPLEQTIVNEKYTISHIDLLNAETPESPAFSLAASSESHTPIDPFSSNETRDGGMTPGPFEEMRRRMAGLSSNSDRTAGPSTATSTKTRREKKRQWRWTIGQEDENDVPEDEISGALIALRACEQSQKKARLSEEPSDVPAPSQTPTVSAPVLRVPTLRLKKPALSCPNSGVPRTLPVVPLNAQFSNQSPDMDVYDSSASSVMGESSSVAGGDTDTDMDTEGDTEDEPMMDGSVELKTPVMGSRQWPEILGSKPQLRLSVPYSSRMLS